MSGADHKKLIRDTFAAWAAGNGNAVFDLLSEDVKWTVIGSTRASRSYHDKREFFEGAVLPITGQLATPIVPKVIDILADGDKVAVQWEGTATAKNGIPYNQSYCWVMRVEGGKVREGIAYLDTELISRLWS